MTLNFFVDSLAGVVDGREGEVLMLLGKEFFVIGGHLCRTIEDGGAVFEHATVREGFEDDFVADTVDVALRDGEFYFV
jgi:hypothetical protein